jgi:hypothetical protein
VLKIRYDKITKTAEERKQLIEITKTLLSSREHFTVHREVSAWAAIVVYTAGLFNAAKYLLSGIHMNCCTLILTIVSTVFILFVLCVFIHTQYAIRTAVEANEKGISRTLFKLQKNEATLLDEDMLLEGKTFYPKFIDKEIKDCTKGLHDKSNIWPWVIYCKLPKKYEGISKANILESTLYNFAIIPTLIFLIVVICQYFLLHD